MQDTEVTALYELLHKCPNVRQRIMQSVWRWDDSPYKFIFLRIFLCGSYNKDTVHTETDSNVLGVMAEWGE